MMCWQFDFVENYGVIGVGYLWILVSFILFVFISIYFKIKINKIYKIKIYFIDIVLPCIVSILVPFILIFLLKYYGVDETQYLIILLILFFTLIITTFSANFHSCHSWTSNRVFSPSPNPILP